MKRIAAITSSSPILKASKITEQEFCSISPILKADSFRLRPMNEMMEKVTGTAAIPHKIPVPVTRRHQKPKRIYLQKHYNKQPEKKNALSQSDIIYRAKDRPTKERLTTIYEPAGDYEDKSIPDRPTYNDDAILIYSNVEYFDDSESEVEIVETPEPSAQFFERPQILIKRIVQSKGSSEDVTPAKNTTGRKRGIEIEAVSRHSEQNITRQRDFASENLVENSQNEALSEQPEIQNTIERPQETVEEPIARKRICRESDSNTNSLEQPKEKVSRRDRRSEVKGLLDLQKRSKGDSESEEEYNRVIYDPDDTCKRKGLRKRKVMKPYWTRRTDVGVKFSNKLHTAKQEHLRKSLVSQAAKSLITSNLCATDLEKVMQNDPKITKEFKKSNKRKLKKCFKDNRKSKNSSRRNRSTFYTKETENLTLSIQTEANNYFVLSDNAAKLFSNFHNAEPNLNGNNNKPRKSINTANYDLATVDDATFLNCNNGKTSKALTIAQISF